MVEIKLFIELYWGKRRPNFDLLLNNQILTPTSTSITQYNTYQENAVITYQSNLLKNNKLELIMNDKQDQDLIQINNEYIDHWIKIRELEVDGIKFETCLYNACKFCHSMSDEWVDQMTQQGYNIQKEYVQGTEMHLNGVWSIQFDTPIWQWCAERYLK